MWHIDEAGPNTSAKVPRVMSTTLAIGEQKKKAAEWDDETKGRDWQMLVDVREIRRKFRVRKRKRGLCER